MSATSPFENNLFELFAAPFGMYAVIHGRWWLAAGTFAAVICVRVARVFYPKRLKVILNGSQISSSFTRQRRARPYLPRSSHKIVFSGKPIKSLDSAITRSRRSLLNRLTPDNPELILKKLIETLQVVQVGEDTQFGFPEDFVEIWCLLFEAAQYQPEFAKIFADFAQRFLSEVRLRSEEAWSCALALLWKQCQSSWSVVCLDFSAEAGGKNTGNLSPDDQEDLRTKLRIKRRAAAELLAGFGLEGLVSWEGLQGLLFPIISESNRDHVIELVCWFYRGVGEGWGRIPGLSETWKFVLAKKDFVSKRIKFLIEDVSKLEQQKQRLWKK